MSDYISRQAAFEALAGWKISPIVLDPVPSADVRENVRGEWIENNGRYGWHCNQCNKDNVYAYITGNDGSHELQDNFCPNCGADMRGDQT